MEIRLKDDVAVVTGGSGVLGGAMAKALAACGAKVAVLGRSLERARSVVDQIEEAGGTGIAVSCDVLDRSAVVGAAEQIESDLGPVSILVNGAGGNKKEATATDDLSFFDLPEDAVQWVFNLNFIGTLLPCQVFGRGMAERKKGNIINISSMSAFTPLTRIAAYSAAKAAVSNFTQWLAVHMSQNYSTDIRVNAIAPGFFLTEQNRFLLQKEDGGWTARGQQILDHTPMGRFGEPEDLDSTLLWLASPASRFVHGIVVPVDGGFSSFSGV